MNDFCSPSRRMLKKEVSHGAGLENPVSYCTTDCTTRFFGMARRHPLRKAGCSKELWSREWDLNPQPPLYESGALPLSYLGRRVISDFLFFCPNLS